MLGLGEKLLLLYVAMLPIVRPLNFRFQGLQVPFSDLVFAAAFGAWCVALLRRRTSLRPARLYYFVGGYALAMTLAAAFSEAPAKSFVKLLAVYYLIAVGLMVFNLACDLSFLKKIVFAFLVGAVITVIGSLAGAVGFYASSDFLSFFLSHYGSLPAGNYPRVKAFFENANMMCNYLNVCFMIALAAGSAGWIRRGVAYALAFLIALSALLTLSAGVGGIVVSAGLWYGLWERRRNALRAMAVLIATAIIAIGLFAATMVSPDTPNTDIQTKLPGVETEVELAVRPLIWKNALIRSLEHPILGRGTGTDAADIYYVAVSGQLQWLHDAHNAWLNIFGQAGLIGLAAFTALCLYLWSICRFTSAHPVLIALSCAFAGAFLFQNLFGSFEDARHLWILVGLLTAAASPGTLDAIGGEDGTEPAYGSP